MATKHPSLSSAQKIGEQTQPSHLHLPPTKEIISNSTPLESLSTFEINRRQAWTQTAAAAISLVTISNTNIQPSNAEETSKQINLFLPPTTSTQGIQSNTLSLSSSSSNIFVSADPRYFLAGGACASISHGLATPFDVVKTRIQATPEDFVDLNLWSSMQKIIKGKEGISVLLGGLGPTMIGYFVEGGVKFGIYEGLKPIMLSLLSSSSSSSALLLSLDSTLVPYALASVSAGAAASILLCPLEDARIKIVTDPEYAEGGMLNAIPKILQTEGILSTFSGMPAMLTKQVPYTLMKQLSFEYVTSFFYGLVAGSTMLSSFSTINLKWEISIVSAFLASIVACIASQPGDLLLTETYKGQEEEDTNQGRDSKFSMDEVLHDEKKMNIAVLATRIWEADGFGGFFVGLKPRLIHVASIITSQLVLYDFIKQLLGLPATGTS